MNRTVRQVLRTMTGSADNGPARHALDPASLRTGLRHHFGKQGQKLAVKSQQRAAQALGQHHELGVVAGTARMDGELQRLAKFRASMAFALNGVHQLLHR